MRRGKSRSQEKEQTAGYNINAEKSGTVVSIEVSFQQIASLFRSPN
jgi:hypothetical protein